MNQIQYPEQSIKQHLNRRIQTLLKAITEIDGISFEPSAVEDAYHHWMLDTGNVPLLNWLGCTNSQVEGICKEIQHIRFLIYQLDRLVEEADIGRNLRVTLKAILRPEMQALDRLEDSRPPTD
jgi:hypothetical protein